MSAEVIKQARAALQSGDFRGAEQIARDRLQAEVDRIMFAGAPAGMAFANGFVVVRDGAAQR